MSRLTIDITEQQHQNLKAMAALQGKTIRQYAMERLFPVPQDSEEAWQELKALIEQRIRDGLAGRPSGKSVSAILEEELGRSSRA